MRYQALLFEIGFITEALDVDLADLDPPTSVAN
jgi:hypothetical protein